MNPYGVVLRKLRHLRGLSIKKAAQHIERSAGWLSEIENNKGRTRINTKEFDRIISLYDGEQHRKKFAAWISHAQRTKPGHGKGTNFPGSVLKHLRQKAGLTLEKAATGSGISKTYLSTMERGEKPISRQRRNQLLKLYGYKESSFKNFTTGDRRSKTVPVRFKLRELLRQLDEPAIEEVFGFVLKNFVATNQNENENLNKDLETYEGRSV